MLYSRKHKFRIKHLNQVKPIEHQLVTGVDIVVNVDHENGNVHMHAKTETDVVRVCLLWLGNLYPAVAY